MLRSLATLLILLAACGNGEQTVQGQVTDLQSRSLTEIATLTVQDDAGRLWAFQAEGPINYTPSHLREHRLTGQPVTVYYRNEGNGRDEGERLLAVRITD